MVVLIREDGLCNDIHYAYWCNLVLTGDGERFSG